MKIIVERIVSKYTLLGGTKGGKKKKKKRKFGCFAIRQGGGVLGLNALAFGLVLRG